MKRRKLLLRLVALSATFAFGATLVANHNVTPTKVEAAQYLGDYAPYTYSGSYYDTIDFDAAGGMNGALRTSLTNLIIPKGFYSYSGTGDTKLSTQLQYADEDPNNSSNMIYLYTRNSVAKNPATTWNREHVWPQSLSNGNWGTSEGGTDILHLRPTYGSTNSSRGNKVYGDNNKSGPKYYEGMLYAYTGGSYFEPLDSVKGDVARIIMYLWTTYTGYPGYSSLNILNVFQNYDTLLRWHTLDKPDALEGNRNDYAQTSRQKNRNPFVDHPELGWKIFGDNASTSVKNACMQAYPANGSGGDTIDPTGIRLNKTTASLEVGKALQLNATLQPNGATGTVYWSTDNNGVASVNSNGLVTANSVGTARITATTGAYNATCTVTVSAAVSNYGTLENPLSVADAIEVINNSGGTTTQPLYIKGIVSSNSAITAYGDYNEIWLQSDDGRTEQAFELYRATLDSSILDNYDAADSLQGYEIVTYGYGKLYNTTYELATSSNEPKKPTIMSVNPPEATDISLDKTSASVNVGETVTLIATLTPSNSTSPYTWESSDESIATVSNGVVTGVAAGRVTITARVSESVEAECEVTVIAVNNTLEATLKYNGDSNKTCADYSDDALVEILNLDKNLFSVVYDKNSASTEMALRTDGIRMYATKQTTNGNKITVKALNSYVIKTIDIDFDNGYSSTAVVSNSTETLSPVDGVYTVNDNEFTIFNNNSAVNTNTQVRFQKIDITYEEPTANQAISDLNTKSVLSYNYTREGNGYTDTLNNANTIDSTDSTYTDWTTNLSSGVSYKGQSGGQHTSIQLRTNNNNSGIVTTANTNELDANKVTITWNTNTSSGRSVQIYGKNEPFSSEAESATELYGNNKGTLLGTLAYNNRDANNKTELTIDGSYKYIGIKSASGALYLESVDIQWGEPAVYTYSDVAIRFGGYISVDMWNRFNNESTITGYGILLSDENKLDDIDIEDWYNTAKTNENTIDEALDEACSSGTYMKNYFYRIPEDKANPPLAEAGQVEGLSEDYYIWNLCKKVSTDKFTLMYKAVAYIRTEDSIIFLKEAKCSVKSLALGLISSGQCDEDAYDGSLSHLANLV